MEIISKLPKYMTDRIRWLMLARVIIVSFILGVAAFVEMMGMESLATISPGILFKATLLTYFLSFLFLFLLKSLRDISLNIYIQCVCDLSLITAMVYATGGMHSIYSVFYPLVIIYAVLFLGKKGGLVVASTAGIFYGIFVYLEFYGVIYPIFSLALPVSFQNATYIFGRILIHIVTFYLIAFLASFVVDQEARLRKLLAEKQSAFEQLDLLHRSIIESVDTGILTVDLEGKITSFNRAAAEITGLSRISVLNRTYGGVFPGGPQLETGRVAMGNRAPVMTRFEIPFQKGEGKYLSLGGSVSPLRDRLGQVIGNIVIFQDLTAINEMRESLEKSRRLAFVGEMAAALAHEIRNPLASIGGSIQMLKRDPRRGETTERLMQIILRGKDQLESFLRDFLLIARPAPGLREEIDLPSMVGEVIESLRCVADWHEPLELKVKPVPEPIVICVNRTEVRQILWNVLLNALQSMPEGGRMDVEIGRLPDGDREGVEIKVSDSGCGIARQDLKKIFEPFYTTRERGTGLGLAVVSRIVEGYGGRVRIDSEPGRGTLCSIWMPLRPERESTPDALKEGRTV
jgi:two-component system sensor histidine kinase PilS (NtrC family)